MSGRTGEGNGRELERRDVLRRTAAGAAFGAAVVAAPSITGIGTAPAFGQLGSIICDPLTGTVMTGETTLFGITIPALTTPIAADVVDPGQCELCVTLPGDPALPNINAVLSITLSTGDVINDTFNPTVGGTFCAQFACPIGVPVSVVSLDGTVFGFGFNLPIISQTPIVNNCI